VHRRNRRRSYSSGCEYALEEDEVCRDFFCDVFRDGAAILSIEVAGGVGGFEALDRDGRSRASSYDRQ